MSTKGKLIITILMIAAIFIAPYVVLVGWNCARELWPSLPEATYHHAFWISNAIGVMFKARLSTGGN